MENILKGIPQDCTFNQNKFTERKGGLGLHSHNYNSLDLKNCTDRLPILLQKEVIAFLLDSEEKANSWAYLMVGIGFATPDRKSTVVYSVGQPMGAYSSFTTMALTHHLIIRYSARLVGKPNFTDYWVLGDDVVIMDDDVATSYKRIISSLGVEISLEKSLVSRDTFEFAKRLFHQGNEVSHLPSSAMTEWSHKHYVLAAILKPYVDRKMIISHCSGFPGFCLALTTLYKQLGLPVKQAGRIVTKIEGILLYYRLVEH